MKKQKARRTQPKKNGSVVTIKEILANSGIVAMSRKAVRLDDIKVDMRYQRGFKVKKAAKIRSAFNAAVCGLLLISKRSNGDLYVIDGNHRLNVLRSLGLKNWEAVIVEGLTPKQEAHVFRTVNSVRSSVLSVETFKARLFEAEESALKIKKVVEDNGFYLYLKPHGSPTDGRGVKAISAIERVYRSGGEDALNRVFEIIRRSWDEGQAARIKAPVIWGLHSFCIMPSWSDRFDLDLLCKKLSTVSVKKLLMEVSASVQLWGGHSYIAFAKTVACLYNKRLGNKRKLPIQ